MKESYAAIKALELLGWNVVEAHEGYAYLMKDKLTMYIQVDDWKAYTGDKECPCCGRDEVVLKDECPECQEDWEYRKDIDQEYLDTTISDTTDLTHTIFNGHLEFARKILNFKKGA